jgi:arginine decarboxylase
VVQLNQQTYTSYVQDQYNISGEGPITDFLNRRNNDLFFCDRVNLSTMARRYHTPLEIACYPQITRQVRRMHAWAARAQQETDYQGAFVYAYATKANFTADVVRTALEAGAHYETSAVTDVQIAGHLWRQGILPSDRLIFCNGSKEPAYLEAIHNLRMDGCTNVVSILDDLEELAELQNCPLPMQFGIRERAVGNRDGNHLGNDRFGLTAEEIDRVVERLDQSQHRLVVYHAMMGSQIEDREHFVHTLRESVEAYCRLRQRVPSLRYFNFGGGVPTSGYNLNFSFDYVDFLRTLMACIRDTCARYSVPMPDLVGEFGRYTVATHSMYLFDVGAVKAGTGNEPDWYLINGSLMVTLPDMLMVKDQQFLMLPINHWDAPLRPVRLAGRRTCDSDDVYPRPNQAPMLLPGVGAGLTVAVFGTGAYQQQLAGLGGAHHCLNPEPRRVAFYDVDGQLTMQRTPEQEQADIMRLLGYPQPVVLPGSTMVPLRHIERKQAS